LELGSHAPATVSRVSHLHMTLAPGSRQILINLEKDGAMLDLARVGVRGLEAACMYGIRGDACENCVLGDN